MTICPKCKAENRPEAAFCARCGSILLAQPTPVKSAPYVQPAEEVSPPVKTPEESGMAEPTTPTTPETPAPAPRFSPRSSGSIFGDRFQYNDILTLDEHEIQYIVTELYKPEAPTVRMCSNRDCRTIHIPAGSEQEKFCTYCGQPLEESSPLLLLQESDNNRYAGQDAIIDLHLAHPGIHPPVATFQEELPEGLRYYLVTPYSYEPPTNPELAQVLDWGLQLASSLDYLHANGVVFGEELQPYAFGMVDDRIVWRNFDSVRVLPMLTDRDKVNDVRLLAISLYSWLTGKAEYSPDPTIDPRLNRLFHHALVGEGFTSAVELANEIEQVKDASLTPFNLDYLVGRRTHSGRVRAINEDSLFCLTASTAQQGISQPMGIYAIADGMGGHATGDVASSLAIHTVAHKVCSELYTFNNLTTEGYTLWLAQVVQSANQAVFEARQDANSDMGSTLTCALVLGNQAYLAHLGDSRIYLLRGGVIKQLTTDHSVVQQLVSIGKLTPEEARTHPQRNVIYRSLGEKPQAEPDIYTQELQSGDRLLLCSDGLHGMLDDQRIQILINESPSPQVACDYLVDAANLAGGEDNISMIIVLVMST